MTLAYDHANRRSEYASGTTTATYTYNGDGLRMAKTAAGTTTSFVWDAAEGLPLVLQAGTTSYVTGPGGLPLAQMLGGELAARLIADTIAVKDMPAGTTIKLC